MITKAYDKIIKAITPIMEEKGFTEDTENKSFIVNNDRVIKVEYNEDAKTYELKSCGYADEKADENWVVLSSWLFDDNSDDKDIASICNDFEYTLKEKLSVSQPKARFVEKGGKAVASSDDVESFTQKFLTLYPQYKDNYAWMMDKYGVFLPEEFFSTYGREKLLELMNLGEKKPIEKFAKFLSDFYEESNPEVRSIVTSTILTGLIGYEGNEKSFETLFGGMSEILSDNAKATLKLYKNRKDV